MRTNPTEQPTKGPSEQSALSGGSRTAAPSHPKQPRPVLVLNASMEPLSVVAARRAVRLVLANKATVVHEDGAWFRSPSFAMKAPTVVRLERQVHVPRRSRAGLSRRAVFMRDGHRCQYCGGAAEDVDHVVPRSRGGQHVWENVVAACRRCNGRKQDRTPREAQLALARKPLAPPPVFWLIVRAGKPGESWAPYLAPFLGERWSSVLGMPSTS